MRMKNFASSSTPYCPNVMQTRNGVTLRYCRPCQVAGGERAEKAAWCKGRGSPNYCTFEIQVENTEAHGSDDLDADAEASEIGSDDSESDVDDSGSDADASESATDRCSPSTSSDDSVPASVLNPRLVDPRYMPSIICQWNSTSPRRCKHCRSAGGERADRAAWCRGRVTAKDCSFQQDDCNIRPTSYPARENEIQYESKGPRTPPLRSEVSPLNEPRHVLMCKLCRDAGSERARNAALCTGRLGKNRCRFESARTPSLIEEAAGDKHTPDRIRLAERLSLSDTPESQTNGSAETREPAVHSSGSGRVKRKRVILTPPPSSPAPEDNFDGRETASPFSLALSLGSRLSAPSQESLKEGPNPSSPRTTIPLSIAARSHPLSSSMPPSSPPPRPDSPHPLIRLRDRPTPSPSLSAAPISSSPLAQLSVPPSSPPSKRSSNLDSLPVTMGPTPPPSTAGGRSCSASSDSVPLHFPPRRSSLRRTFDGANITTLSVKKARFSMHPRSPLQEPSSNPLMAGTPDDDELLLRDTSSMASSYTRSSPAYRYGSSPSPFSREMSVRAADVGLKLGPEHTGRLPFGMLAALAPSLSPSRGAHSLESAISQTSSMPSYALPTPPRSFGSSASSSSHFGSAGSPSKSTAGLMLPPPVPVKLLSFVRPLTPMEDPKPLPDIKFTTQSPALLRTHSRSLSVSVARTSRRQSFALVPNTTPRKRSRLERDLAKVARVAGDEAGLEWGMDEEVGEDLGRIWREGSVVRYLD